MAILPNTLPTAGPFRSGTWNGRELIVTHRRWFPAILCWIIASTVSLWCLAGKLYPSSNYVPEPDHIPVLLGIASAIAAVGAVVALWSRTFAITKNAIVTTSGFPVLHRTSRQTGQTYLQIHPLKTTLRARVQTTWEGFALVAHLAEHDGAILSAFRNPEEAIADAAHVESESGIALHREPGATITRTV